MSKLRGKGRHVVSVVAVLSSLFGVALAGGVNPARGTVTHAGLAGHFAVDRPDTPAPGASAPGVGAAATGLLGGDLLGPDGFSINGAGRRDRLRLAVPAYWSAGTPDGAAAFDRLIAAASTVDTVIINGPASGPAVPFDPELATTIRRMSAEGVTVLGYVDTGYLGRTGQLTTRLRAGSTAVADWRAQAGADAAIWRGLYAGYGLGGIFFDQTLPGCGEDDEYVDAYAAISERVRRRWPKAAVVINPGIGVEECYTTVADVIVIAENSLDAYRTWTPPDWVHDHRRDRFWHLIHGASTGEQMAAALALARERNAGHVFVTDAVLDGRGGPWNVLPPDPYWSRLLASVAVGVRGCPGKP